MYRRRRSRSPRRGTGERPAKTTNPLRSCVHPLGLYSDFHGHNARIMGCLRLAAGGKLQRIKANTCGCRAISHGYWARSRRSSPDHARSSCLGSVHAACSPSVFEGVLLVCWSYYVFGPSFWFPSGMAFPCRAGCSILS